jgi:hypothetical protein
LGHSSGLQQASEQATSYDVRFYDIDGFKADEVDIPTVYGYNGGAAGTAIENDSPIQILVGELPHVRERNPTAKGFAICCNPVET